MRRRKDKKRSDTGVPDHLPGTPPAGSSHTEGGTAAVQPAVVKPQAASGHVLCEEQRLDRLLLLRVGNQ